MHDSRWTVAVLDCATGLLALGLCALTVLLQPYSELAFELLLFGAPAALFPIATGLRASGRRVPRWLTFVLVNVSAVLAAALLAALAEVSVLSLVPVSAVVLAGGAAVTLAPGIRRRWVRPAVLSCTVAVALALVPSTMSSWLVRPASLAAAPDVALPMVDGKTLQLGSQRGRVVVLNFWGTYCPPCLRELPELEAVAQAYRGDPSVLFVAVEVGQAKDAEVVGAFAAQHGLDLPLAFDPDERVQHALGIHGTPTTLVIDPAGVVRQRRVGYLATADFAGWLRTTIDALAPHSS